MVAISSLSVGVCTNRCDALQALDKKSGKTVALKVLQVAGAGGEEEMDIASVQKEIEFMKQLSCCEFIVAYYGAWSSASEVWIAMEYCEIGSVLDLLRIVQTPFPEGAIVSIAKDMVYGLAFLHGRNVIHRDVKGEKHT